MPHFADLDRLRADLDALRPLAPEQEARVLQKFRLEWNYNSNAIEGNSLTLGETRSLLLHGLTAAGKPMRDHLDIKGHNEAVVALEEFVRSEYPLTEQFIREMHQLLLGEAYEVPAQTAGGQPTRKRIVPGRYKTSPNNVLTATGEMFYFASVEETPGRMTDLVDWYRAEEAAPTLHPVALAAEFHYRFVRIHPFDDGNGRMSRLLMNLILLRHGYPMTVIQAADRNRYLAALAEADAGEPEPFLRFIIENVEASLRLMIRAARGESIDELAVLDEKLTWLKKHVLGQDTPEPEWDEQTQRTFYDNLLNFWLENINEQTRGFDSLFAEVSYTFHVRAWQWQPRSNSGEKPFINEHTDFNEFKAMLRTVLSNSEIRFNAVSFSKQWHRFRQSNNTFSTQAGASFHFSFSDFLVSEGVRPVGGHGGSYSYFHWDTFNAPYSSTYDLSRIHEINHQLANKVYDFIAAKLAEADTPPA